MIRASAWNNARIDTEVEHIRSRRADNPWRPLVIVGFDLEGLRERGAELFASHPSLNAALFVQAADRDRVA